MLAWVLTEGIAFGFAGGGHGWTLPTLLSLPLLFIYPMAFVRLSSRRGGRRHYEVGILAGAIALDTMLVFNVIREENQYFRDAWSHTPGMVAGWLALWAGWQILTLIRLFDRRI